MAARHQPSHEEAEKAIGTLVRTLQQNLRSQTDIRVNEVVKAGSMGHGTTVPGNFDIDLVLYSSDVRADTVNDEGYEPYLRKLTGFFGNPSIFGRQVTEINTTRYAVQFLYKGYLNVDFLISPVWWASQDNKVPQLLFKFLRDSVEDDEEERHKFTVNASKWQVMFMTAKLHEFPQAKEYIIRAKAWRNKLWPKGQGGRGRPSSYLLSLLVLKAYEQQARDPGDAARSTTEQLKRIVRDHGRMNIYWESYYKKEDYPNLFPQSLPRLVDPANPANNVYESGIGPYPKNKRPNDYERGDGDWEEFQKYVERFDLTKSLASIQI